MYTYSILMDSAFMKIHFVVLDIHNLYRKMKRYFVVIVNKTGVFCPINISIFFRYWGDQNPLETVGEYWNLSEKWTNITQDAEKKTFIFNTILAMPGIFANWPKDFRRSIAYQYHDLIIACTYEGGLCNQSSFIVYEHSEFFNCYTFQLSNVTYVRAGPENGLTLLLYIG